MDLLRSFKDNCGFGLLANIHNIPSHQNVEDAIVSLERMMHRGAIAADGKSGDGSGLLFGMQTEFMKRVAAEAGVDLPEQFAVGMLFLSDENQKEVVREICADNDIKVQLFREVPVDTN
ncbi:MAG TPA: glutamate synthase large subunit, partial [Campylobacteraceae bacterium]|nr:glutamate synthase large subunit [Campylobacteraceae bacterium]